MPLDPACRVPQFAVEILLSYLQVLRVCDWASGVISPDSMLQIGYRYENEYTNAVPYIKRRPNFYVGLDFYVVLFKVFYDFYADTPLVVELAWVLLVSSFHHTRVSTSSPRPQRTNELISR